MCIVFFVLGIVQRSCIIVFTNECPEHATLAPMEHTATSTLQTTAVEAIRNSCLPVLISACTRVVIWFGRALVAHPRYVVAF